MLCCSLLLCVDPGLLLGELTTSIVGLMVWSPSLLGKTFRRIFNNSCFVLGHSPAPDFCADFVFAPVLGSSVNSWDSCFIFNLRKINTCYYTDTACAREVDGDRW